MFRDCVSGRVLAGGGSSVGLQVSSQNTWTCCGYDWILTLMGWKWAQVDIHSPLVSEGYCRKCIKLEGLSRNWWGIIMGATSGGVIQKIVVRVWAIYYQLLKGTLVMHCQIDLPTDMQYVPPTMSSLKYKTFRSHLLPLYYNAHISHYNVCHL